MTEIKYEKLDRIREDIKRDKAKVVKLQEQIKQKEARLKEAEAGQIVADVGAMNMSPEQLGQFLALIQNGQLNAILSGQVNVPGSVADSNAANASAGYEKETSYEEDEYESNDEKDEDEEDETYEN